MSEASSTPAGADGNKPFDLQYFPPDPDLAEMVSSFYFVRVDLPIFDESERAAFNALFLNEARAAAGLNHAHIVTVFDAGVSDNRAR